MKKKSLVGWIREDWDMDWHDMKTKYGYRLSTELRHNAIVPKEIDRRKPSHKRVKVRITIEEIK